MKLILFGAGEQGSKALTFFGTENVHCFVDNYKFGTSFCKKNIISFGELLKIIDNKCRVIITTEFYQNQIVEQLQNYDIPFGIFTTQEKQPERHKIDVEDIFNQLNSTKLKAYLTNFMAWNHRWVALLSYQNNEVGKERYDFIKNEMPKAAFVLNQFDVIKSKVTEITFKDGHILDLGVYKGASTKRLANIFPNRTIHGFDSFEGLPEDWSYCLKGTFGEIKGSLPPDMPDNVKLYKGYFNDTLPQWLKENNANPISLLRIDCDIYSSTKTIFEVLSPLIIEGTLDMF